MVLSIWIGYRINWIISEVQASKIFFFIIVALKKLLAPLRSIIGTCSVFCHSFSVSPGVYCFENCRTYKIAKLSLAYLFIHWILKLKMYILQFCLHICYRCTANFNGLREAVQACTKKLSSKHTWKLGNLIHLTSFHYSTEWVIVNVAHIFIVFFRAGKVLPVYEVKSKFPSLECLWLELCFI